MPSQCRFTVCQGGHSVEVTVVMIQDMSEFVDRDVLAVWTGVKVFDDVHRR